MGSVSAGDGVAVKSGLFCRCFINFFVCFLFKNDLYVEIPEIINIRYKCTVISKIESF